MNKNGFIISGLNSLQLKLIFKAPDSEKV